MKHINLKKPISNSEQKFIMSTKNRVIAGDYAGKQVLGGEAAQAGIALGFIKQLYFNKITVESLPYSI